MIIELLGPSGSGKSSIARKWEADGFLRVRSLSRGELIIENVRYILRRPVRALLQLYWIVRSAPAAMRYSLVMNAFVVSNAKYERASRLSKHGQIVVIDQGHFQSMLTIFSDVPDRAKLQRYVGTLPLPDTLIIVDVPKEVREARLAGRQWQSREEFGPEESLRAKAVADQIWDYVPEILPGDVQYLTLSGEIEIYELFSRNLTYVTAARMPTEKAHGISISHMCASLSRIGCSVSLIVPTRRTKTQEDLWAYYSVPESFSFKRVASPDLLGRGYTRPFFFFLQRLLFVRALRSESIPAGIVYTREPEIAWQFSSSHLVIFEAHSWPAGLRSWVQKMLVRRSALIVCNSIGTQSAVIASGVAHTMVAPNGFAPEQFEQAESKDAARKRLDLSMSQTIALYIGALDDRKGVRGLFAAAPLLQSISVVAIGGNEHETASLSREYPSVHFRGFRPYREIANNLAAADVLVLPNTMTSQESSQFTSPIKLFAYMASGKPIVASNVPAVKAFLNSGNSFLVPADNPEALASGISEAMRDKEESNRRAVQARSDVQAFTWDARARKILSALHATL